MTYRLVYDFKITRRIAIDFTSDEFFGHVAKVVDRLNQDETIVEEQVHADLDSATLEIELTVSAENEIEAREVAGRSLANAIRAAGGTHIGLLPEPDERRYFKVSYSGLRRQEWRHRGVELMTV